MQPGDLNKIDIKKTAAQEIPTEMFAHLNKDDILFLDTTHVIKTNSDVLYEFFEILPTLNPGVIIHIHDVLYPFEYPKEWVIDEARSWSELYFLRGWLAANNGYEIIFFNDYFMRFFSEIIDKDFPAFFRNSGGSLWLRKL